MGSLVDSPCLSTRDCDPSLFCDIDYRCKKLKENNQPCSNNFECHPLSFCRVSETSLTGVCTALMSLEDGTNLRHVQSSVFGQYSGSMETTRFTAGDTFPGKFLTKKYDNNMNRAFSELRFLCKSGYMNPVTFNCEKPPKSFSGIRPMVTPCSSNQDCRTQNPQIFAPCKCPFLTGVSSGDLNSKVCFPAYGDDLGTEEVTLFSSLVEKGKAIAEKCNRSYFDFFAPINQQ